MDDVASWLTFANLCKETFGECHFQDQLVQECGGNPDIAWADFHHLGSDSVPWLHRHVPALDGARPVDLMTSGNADLVRDCLWSFPY